MEDLELREAQLYRLLINMFGRDQVIPKATIRMVCGGELPNLPAARYPHYQSWAKSFRCLFTVVNSVDEPRLVVEFCQGFEESVDVYEAEREHYLPSVLKCRDISYVTISNQEFEELLSADGDFNFFHVMEDQLGDKFVDQMRE